MVIRAARNDVIATLNQHLNHRFGVFCHLLLVGFEFRLHRLFERNRFTSDNVHQRTALTAREDSRVQFLIEIFVAVFRQNDTTARTRQRFVSGRGHDVRMRDRTRVNVCSNQAGNVCHVHKQPCTYAIRDFAHFRPVANAGVRRESANDHFWLVGFRQFSQFVVVNFTGLIDTVSHNVIEFARQVNR